jgi:acetyl-CoA acetyltransferase
MRDVYVVATSCTAFGKRADDSFRDLALEALTGAAEDAQLDLAADLGSLWFGNCFMHAWDQPNIRGQVTLVDMVDKGLLPRRLPVTNVEAACATGSLAFQSAVRDVRSGEVELSAALGVEKMVLPASEKTRIFQLFEGCTDNVSRERLIALYQEAADGLGQPLEFRGDRSMFMDTYAIQAQLHMQRYGTTAAHLAAGCAKNHNYGALNPLAQYRFTTTPEEVLADRAISGPITRSMCAPVGDGAAAAVVCSGEWLAAQPEAVRSRALRVAGMGAAGGTYGRTSYEPTLSHHAAQKAFQQAGLAPTDVDVVELHDATSFGEVLQMEMLGFCPEGRGGPFVADGATGPGGVIPTNTSGGLVSKGHPIGATGLSMLHELAVQLRGEAGPRQVPEARVGLAENGGGVIGLEEAACAVTILERVS